MTDKTEYSNEQLTAYLDGEASPELVAGIEAALATDPDLQARLAALETDVDTIKSAFDAVLPNAPEPPILAEQAEPASSGIPPWAAAMVAVICLAIGWFASGLLRSEPVETWQQYAAAYHLLYVKNTLYGVGQDEVTATSQLQKVSRALGHDIPLAALKHDNLDYRRAQILGFKGRPLIQLAFLSKAGTPFALCVTRASSRVDSPPETTTIQGLSAATWSSGGMEYLLVGGTDDNLTASAAKVFSERL